MSKDSACYRRAPGTARMEEPGYSLKERVTYFLRNSCIGPHWGISTEEFSAHFCIFLNANLPAPKNEKNKLFTHVMLMF